MTGIAAIRLVSVDPDALARFYVDRLGFRDNGAVDTPRDPFGARVRRMLRLSLGGQAIELAAFDDMPAGAPPVAADDLRFQHFAMIAPDMDRAFERLDAGAGWTAISRGGPVALPPSSGGVRAFKFRDPEGHPLELLTYPDGGLPDHWRAVAAGTDAALLGIDHTAIVVAETGAAVAHYVAQGFAQVGGSLNEGPEQAALDGLDAPRVEVTTLRAGDGRPHLELLCYGPRALAAPLDDADPRATRIVLDPDGAAARDPDGHRRIGALRSPQQGG